MIDFTNIEYLKKGNLLQQNAYKILNDNAVLSKIAEFTPILVGTIPINIAIENSDLDIICFWKNKTEFTEKLNSHFANENQFKISALLIDDIETVVANFRIDDFEIEIFGQDIPVLNQNGYRHMLIENEILTSKDDNFRLEIIKLKHNGYKTEPAFAELLGLKGNPYQELLHYKPLR